jgi:hypothetical protein
MQSVQSGPDEQVQQQQRGELIEVANEAVRRQPPQAEQRKSAPQIAEQPGAQAVRFEGARGQLRILRSRSMSFS